jgi:cytochrome c biogenesis protein CcdA
VAQQVNDPSDRPAGATPPPQVDLGDVVATVKAYARQETIGPLKGAARWLAVGAAAASALGIGLVLVLLGLLRLLQTEWERSASGSLSWLAYAIVLVVCLALLAFTLSKIKQNSLNKESH